MVSIKKKFFCLYHHIFIIKPSLNHFKQATAYNTSISRVIMIVFYFSKLHRSLHIHWDFEKRHSTKVLNKHMSLLLGFSALVLDKKVDDMSHVTDNKKKSCYY